MNEMISGVRADVAAILFGDDFDVLVAKAAEIERVLKSIPGAADVSAEQVTGQPVLQIRVKQDEIARYGVPAKAVLDLVESLGQQARGRGRRRPVAVSAGGAAAGKGASQARGDRADPGGDAGRRATFRCRGWPTVETVEGPSTITREWGQRRITVTANVRGRDLGSFVAEARAEGGRAGAAAAGPLPRRVGRAVREPAAGPDAADDRRAGRPAS